tara:strand:+ start:88 stop:474 length:387 start_codon:yes stop_codon:yes gene_type:complete
MGMGMSVSAAMHQNEYNVLRNSNTELQRKVTKLEKEIRATIDQQVKSMDRIQAELTDKTKELLKKKNEIIETTEYYTKKLESCENKVSIEKERLKKLHQENSDLKIKYNNVLNAMKTIDKISDNFDTS